MSIRVRLTLLPGLVLAVLALGTLPSTSEAQFGKRLKDAVKRTAEDKAIQKTTEEESKAIDGAIEGGGEAKPDAAPAGGSPQPAATGAGTATGTAAASSETAAAEAAAPKKAGEGAFVNFDFVPGDRVLFYDDFTTDNLGDFPRRLEFEQGNAEMGRWKVAAGQQVRQVRGDPSGGPARSLHRRVRLYHEPKGQQRVADHAEPERRGVELGEPGLV